MKKYSCTIAEVNPLFQTLMNELHLFDCYYSNDGTYVAASHLGS